MKSCLIDFLRLVRHCAKNSKELLDAWIISPKMSVQMGQKMRRLSPNVVICGTPGTGKTSLATKVAQATGLLHVDLSRYAVEHELIDGWDEILNCAILDEDKVVDHLSDSLGSGGYILDYHSCDFLPEDLIDRVYVTRTDNTLLYDRLKARGYPEAKISNNMECEIFQTILDEAKEAFPEDTVVELPSNTTEEQKENLKQILSWITEFKVEHK